LAAAVLACGLVAAPAAQATFIPVSQDRYIFESIGEENFIQTAPDFGPFSAAMTAASQTSTIDPTLISGQGSVGPDPFFSINSATSYFSLVFDIAAPVEYSFNGSLSTGLFGSAQAQLTGPGGELLNLIADEFQSHAWNQTIAFEPGRYTLTVFASNSIGGDLSQFQFGLGIPGPGAMALAALALAAAPRRRRPERR
jgi:hypothetical protein